jgi:hypothetical protein
MFIKWLMPTGRLLTLPGRKLLHMGDLENCPVTGEPCFMRGVALESRDYYAGSAEQLQERTRQQREDLIFLPVRIAGTVFGRNFFSGTEELLETAERRQGMLDAILAVNCTDPSACIVQSGLEAKELALRSTT